MEKLLENWLALLLGGAALGIFMFGFQLRKVTIIEAGKSITPKWCSKVRWIIVLAGIVLFFANFGGLSAFLVYSLVGILGGADRVISVIILAVTWYLCIFAGNTIGAKVRNSLIWEEVKKIFDQDDIAQKMLQDLERGAKEIRVYSMRVEGLRSFHFDVDGLNRSAYSPDGCMQMCRYLKDKIGDTYETDVCYEDDGIQGTSSGSSIQSGKQKYKFSHAILRKKEQ